MSGRGCDFEPGDKGRILGAEACRWTEWVTAENIDHGLARNAAIADACGLRKRFQDPGSMYARLDKLSWRLEWPSLPHRSGNFRCSAHGRSSDISALRMLADVVEPVKEYARHGEREGPLGLRAPLTTSDRCRSVRRANRSAIFTTSCRPTFRRPQGTDS